MKVIPGRHRPIRAWVAQNDLGQPQIENSALEQLQNVSSLPFLHPHGVAVMPDMHTGIGATVGSVIATEKAIIPAAVGVDIGCGMCAACLSGARATDVDEKKLRQIRTEIERTVPSGFGRHEHGAQNARAANALYSDFRWIEEKFPKMFARRKDKPEEIIHSQFGSLGGGNHFIELCTDEKDDLWLMLHSGSRGIGNMIGQFFIELAREEMARLGITLPDRDLAYLEEGTGHFEDYVRAVGWAQTYAAKNREQMLRRILAVLRRHLPAFQLEEGAINCHHNYVAREKHYGIDSWVTRKGAIRAGKGELGIIPGSMGQRSYIVRGKGSKESYESCSHGAGRVMSRGEAKRRFTVEDLRAQTRGVECRKDAGVLDEIPGAYKNIDEVMANQTDLVEPIHTLKQVMCVKGS